MNMNPFAPPAAEETLVASVRRGGFGWADVGEIFAAWELLRVAYVGLLAAETIGMVGLSNVFGSSLKAIIELALVANVLFTLGPLTELFIRWMGYRTWAVRVFLFIVGTLLSIGIAFGELTVLSFPSPD